MDYLISIITAVYNAEKFIKECIQSVIDQSHQNWELLVINDGSTDKTEQIIQSFSDNRIKYFRKENGGVSSARNLGLKEMKGYYFCFLDADDTLPKHSLETRLNPFKENEDICFVDGIVNIQNADLSKTIRTYRPQKVNTPIKEFCLLNPKIFFGPSWTIKRIPDKEYAMHEDLTHGEDYFFYLENLAESNNIAIVNKPILNYRTGTSSAMTNLKGLENGYRTIAEKMKSLPHISEENQQTFKAKTKSIMFKSYLGALKPINALKILFTW